MRYLFLSLLWIVFASSPAAIAKQAHVGKVKPLKLANHYYEELAKDAPIRDLLFEPNKEVLWLLGAKHLWRWNLDTQKLNRLRFNQRSELQGEFKYLGTDGLSIFAATDRELYQVRYSPFKVYKYSHPNAKGVSLGFAARGDLFGWLHSQKSFFVDRYSKSLLDILDGQTPWQARDILYYAESADAVWYARGSKLSVFDLQKKSSRVLREVDGSLMGIAGVGEHVFAYTDKNIYHFSAPKQRLHQVIPVSGDKRVVEVHYAQNIHDYVFDNGSIESYDLRMQKTTYYKLPITKLGERVKFKRQGKLGAVLYNEKFIAFRFE